MHVRPDYTLTVESAWKYAPGPQLVDWAPNFSCLQTGKCHSVQAIEENANFAWSQNFGHKNAIRQRSYERRFTEMGCSNSRLFYQLLLLHTLALGTFTPFCFGLLCPSSLL